MTAIGEGAFEGCKLLASITIPRVFEGWRPAVFHAESKVREFLCVHWPWQRDGLCPSFCWGQFTHTKCRSFRVRTWHACSWGLVRMVAKHLAGLLGGHVQLFFPIFVNHESTGTKSRWPLVSLKFGSLQRVCDSHWGRCLWGLQAFGKHYNPSSLWGLTASRLSCRKQGERVPVCTLTLAERWPLPIFLLGSIYAHEMSLFSCAYMTCEVKAGLLGGHVQLFFPTFVEQRAACLAEIWVFFELFTSWGPMKAICRDLVLFICHPTGF